MPEKTTQSSALQQQLEQAAWRFLDVEVDPAEWWAAEIWHLRSEWSADGPDLWITLLVDPQIETGQRKGDQVWAVGASAARPETRSTASQLATLPLGRGWRRQVPEFLAALEQLRG